MSTGMSKICLLVCMELISNGAFLFRSLLFSRILNNCYLFPFTLVWSNRTSVSHTTQNDLNDIKSKVKNTAIKPSKDLNITELFLSFDDVCSRDLHRLGIYYESLFVSSLGVKYYVWGLSNMPSNSFVPFLTLYDFGGAESKASESLLVKYELNLSEGIFYPPKEAFVDNNLPWTVVHNQNHHNAHHDIILPTNLGCIPVFVKASFDYVIGKINEQWFVFKTSSTKICQWIWLYLDSFANERKQEEVAFLNGSGVCNGLSLDMYILVKKVKIPE